MQPIFSVDFAYVKCTETECMGYILIGSLTEFEMKAIISASLKSPLPPFPNFKGNLNTISTLIFAHLQAKKKFWKNCSSLPYAMWPIGTPSFSGAFSLEGLSFLGNVVSSCWRFEGAWCLHLQVQALYFYCLILKTKAPRPFEKSATA